MKYFLPFILLLLQVIAITSCATAQQTELYPNEARGELNGIRIEVKAPKTVVAGESVPVILTMTNTSDQEKIFYQIDGYYEWGLKVTDGVRASVPRTRYGKRHVRENLEEPLIINGRFSTIKIKPGESHTVTRNLARLFDLSVGDYYAVSAQYDTSPVDGAEKGTRVKSGPAVFKIEE